MEGLGLLRTNAVVVSILGITVLSNFFYFSHFPMVQVVADRVGATPALTGLLASASGFGMITGSLLVARWQPSGAASSTSAAASSPWSPSSVAVE